MNDLLDKLRRALYRHGVGDLAAAAKGTKVAASPAQLLSALYDLEQDGVTLAPMTLSVELREAAVAAARKAKEAGDEPVQALWDALLLQALRELRRQDELRRDVQRRQQAAVDNVLA